MSSEWVVVWHNRRHSVIIDSFAAVTDVLLNSWWIWLNTMNERFTATGQQGLQRSLQCSTGLFCVLLCVVLKPRQSAEVVIGPENPEQKVTLKRKKAIIRMTFWTSYWWGGKHCLWSVNWHSSAGNNVSQNEVKMVLLQRLLCWLW